MHRRVALGLDLLRAELCRKRLDLRRGPPRAQKHAGDASKIDEATHVHYAALYARPGAMRAAFAQFRSFPKDAEDNKASLAARLTMPVLAIGGEKSFGATQAVVMRNAAANVTEVVIAKSGHWLMEEQPAATIAAIRTFLDAKN